MVVSSKLSEQHSVERFFDVDALPEPIEIGSVAVALHATCPTVVGNISLMIWGKFSLSRDASRIRRWRQPCSRL